MARNICDEDIGMMSEIKVRRTEDTGSGLDYGRFSALMMKMARKKRFPYPAYSRRYVRCCPVEYFDHLVKGMMSGIRDVLPMADFEELLKLTG